MTITVFGKEAHPSAVHLVTPITCEGKDAAPDSFSIVSGPVKPLHKSTFDDDFETPKSNRKNLSDWGTSQSCDRSSILVLLQRFDESISLEVASCRGCENTSETIQSIKSIHFERQISNCDSEKSRHIRCRDLIAKDTVFAEEASLWGRGTDCDYGPRFVYELSVNESVMAFKSGNKKQRLYPLIH